MISIPAVGGYDNLVYKTLGDAESTKGANVFEGNEEELVTVDTFACGVNYAEVCTRWGVYKTAKDLVGYPITPGFEFSGRVTKVGSKVTKYKVGDTVFGLTLFGGYSVRVSVPENQLFTLPKDLTLSEAAGFSIVSITAWYALCECCKLRPGSHILVHSAGGGVGSMLVQIGKILGCHVVGVVGSSHKVDYVKELGCDDVIDKSSSDLWTEAEKFAPKGYKAIFDANGIETLSAGYARLGLGGRLVTYGFHTFNPRSTEKGDGKVGMLKTLKMGVDLVKMPWFSSIDLCYNNKSVAGFNLSPLFAEIDIFHCAMDELLGWLAEGKLRVPKVTEYSLETVADAHRALESGKTVGKLVLLSHKEEKVNEVKDEDSKDDSKSKET